MAASKKNKADNGSSFESTMKKVLENANIDRTMTMLFLEQLSSYVHGKPEMLNNYGSVISKFIENLQRSNEQYLKAAAVLSKNHSEEPISEEELENIFDDINKESKIKKEK